MDDLESVRQLAGRLFATVGQSPTLDVPAPLPGGRNNRVFALTVQQQPVGLLKLYFQHAHDPRDRRRNEYEFARFAWDVGCRQLAQPLATSPADNATLFTFLPGRKLQPGEVTREHLSQALQFVACLNRQRDAGTHLPMGSEACFAIEEHFACVDRRLDRLSQQVQDPEILSWIKKKLCRDWKTIRNQLQVTTPLPLDHVLPSEKRCVSPSDFGFHNALVDEDGIVRFLDFEYAGWDDPAKLINDFFCQPAVPVPTDHYTDFTAAVAELIDASGQTLKRAWHLRAVYQTKWAAILLNEFLPVDGARRAFALGVDPALAKETQWRKAQAMLEEAMNTIMEDW